MATLAWAALGCGNDYIRFRPVGFPEAAASGWVEGGLFRLPPGVGSVALSVEARGVTEKPKDGPAERSLDVSFRLQNRSKATFTLDPAEAKVIDDDGHTILGAKAYTVKNPTGALAVPGGGREDGRLVFPLPQEVRFDRIGSVKLVLAYKFGDTAYQATAKFVRSEDAYYYGPYDAPYYYPYFYPYYYGPYYYPYGYPYGYPFDYPYYDGRFRFRGERHERGGHGFPGGGHDR
jgi:hypothetical protein